MSKRVLIVGEEAFIVTSLKQSVEAAGHYVEVSLPKVSDLNTALSKLPELVIIYGGEYIDTATDALIYIRDFVAEHDIRVALLGYTEEIKALERVFQEDNVWTTFERPFNVKDLVEKINGELEKIESGANKKHVLVVDDSGTMLRTVKSWLSMKYKVSIASSAAMAISLLASNKPDLILLDYEMPVCNGPQFLEMIRGEVTTQNIPVIFLTAKNDSESVKKVLALKPDGYLLKTMNQEQVLQSVNDFFEKQKGGN